jgi:hypothetical protein
VHGRILRVISCNTVIKALLFAFVWGAYIRPREKFGIILMGVEN